MVGLAGLYGLNQLCVLGLDSAIKSCQTYHDYTYLTWRDAHALQYNLAWRDAHASTTRSHT